MKIKVGWCNQYGDVYNDLEKVKACNFCIHFDAYGLHGFNGFCNKLNKKLSFIEYPKIAKGCTTFEVIPELLKENNTDKGIDFDTLCELWNTKSQHL